MRKVLGSMMDALIKRATHLSEKVMAHYYHMMESEKTMVVTLDLLRICVCGLCIVVLVPIYVLISGVYKLFYD